MANTFIAYPHVVRLGKEEVEGYLNGRVYLSPKVDGTNSSVWSTKDGVLHCGSRTREITPENDNGGFAAYIMYSSDSVAVALREFCLAHPDVIVYGEWLGDPTNNAKMLGALRKYLKKGFFAFDVRVFEEGKVDDAYVQGHKGFLTPEDGLYQLVQGALGDNFITPVAYLDHPTEEEVMKFVEDNHYNLPDDVIGEGMVLLNYDYRSKWGNFEIAKIVREEFKASKGRKKEFVKAGEIEAGIIDNYVTNADIEKCKQKILLALGLDEWDSRNGKCTGMLMQYVWRDLIEEELPEIVLKKAKGATINFGEMNRLCSNKVREFLGL